MLAIVELSPFGRRIVSRRCRLASGSRSDRALRPRRSALVARWNTLSMRLSPNA
jgi:hypothetical protein